MPDVIRITIPRETVNDESVLVLSWKAPSGTAVERDALLCEIETSKATMEIYAPDAGVLEYTAAEGDEIAVGAPICWIIPAGADVPASMQRTSADAATGGSPSRSTRAARDLAEQHGVDLASFPPGALIRSEDVLRRVGKLSPSADDPDVDSTTASSAGVLLDWKPLPRKKLVEGRILRSVHSAYFRSSVTVSCRISEMRNREDDELAAPGIGLSAFILFESARLLKKYPVFNSVHDRGRIGQYRHVNIGWAIEAGKGLVVPVIRDADQKDVRDIASWLQGRIESYLEGRLSPLDFTGCTFTISDLSGRGVNTFDPLIGAGQSAILAIGKDFISHDEEVLYFTLAFDHQISTGSEAAAFLGELSARLEVHASLDRAPKFCVLCQRDTRCLEALKGILIRSELPRGYVCSICLAGNR